MKTDLNKQDQILSKIGLERVMVWHYQHYFPVYDEEKFKNYVTSEYEESQRKKTDECYRISEFNILHIDSGLRLTLTEHESYDGESEEYKVIRMYITTSIGEELEVVDANFKNEIFYTIDLEIPFSETNKLIEKKQQSRGMGKGSSENTGGNLDAIAFSKSNREVKK